MNAKTASRALADGPVSAPAGPSAWSPCGTPGVLPTCACRIDLTPPPLQADPWIYNGASGQEAQFQAWLSNPSGATPPTFWIPDADWQLANPGWMQPIAFWLPNCGINLYSSSDPNVLPTAPSDSISVTIGNDGGASAVNVQVQLSVSPPGIGYKKTPVAPAQSVGLPADSQATLTFATPASMLQGAPGAAAPWFGATVDLSFSRDANTANNHATSMWVGVVSDQSSAGLSPGFTLINEFSAANASVTLYVLPLLSGVNVLVNGAPSGGALGPYLLAPGQSVVPDFQLTVPGHVDGGTFLAPLATVVGLDADGNFIGGLTVVCSVND